jgi:hypothetical protein
VKLAAALAFALAIVLLVACIVCLWRGDLPPPWLAFSALGAVLTVAGFALVHAWRQS